MLTCKLLPHLIEGMSDRGSFQVKGRDQPVRVYALMDPLIQPR